MELSLDIDVLTNCVRRLLQSPRAHLHAWNVAPLGYRVINRVTGGVYRVTGTASDGVGTHTWSLVLKILHYPVDDPTSDFNASLDATHWNYWRREADVYTSALLTRLPRELAAPQCFAATAPHVDQIWLWMEELGGLPATDWPLARFGQAAHHLAAFHAAYLDPAWLAQFPWLARNWLRAWVPTQSAAQLELLRDPLVWQHPLLAKHLPLALQEQALYLWDMRDAWLHSLEQMQQTLCHFDVWPTNIFQRSSAVTGEQTVLIDWSQAGYGAPGEDPANLVFDSVWMLRVPGAALPAFEQYVWEGYRASLAAAAPTIPVTHTRFTYTAVGALRFGLLASRLLATAHDSAIHPELEQRYGRAIADILEQRALAVAHALGLVREATILWRDL